jgi:CBS domain-containing protein
MHEMFDRIVSLRVSDVMATSPITVDVSASMAEVSHLFASHNIHSAPVVDESGACVGIITASDFVKRSEIFAACQGQPHDMFCGREGMQLEAKSYEGVADCMTQGVQSISPATPLIVAARIMTQAHIHVLPVIEHHRPVGIVSNMDVVAALVNAFEEARNSI